MDASRSQKRSSPPTNRRSATAPLIGSPPDTDPPALRRRLKGLPGCAYRRCPGDPRRPAKGRMPRTLKRRPQETPNPDATANVTDPCSRFLHTRNGTVQGYNAQAVTTMHQLIVAAELTDEANDVHQLDPMLKATATTLAAAGIDERAEALLADSGYWSIDNLTTIPNAPELLIPPARHGRQGKPRKDGKPSASKSDGLRAAP